MLHHKTNEMGMRWVFVLLVVQRLKALWAGKRQIQHSNRLLASGQAIVQLLSLSAGLQNHLNA